MKDTACIAIDLGATSGRVILAKMKHGRLETEILNRFPNVIKEIDGRCYWDIYSLFDSIKEGLNMAASRRIAIDSIGVGTWGVDFVCVRPDGSFVSLPRAYRDPYTEGVPEQYFRHIPREEVYRLTGIQFMNFNSLFQLYAMRLEGSIDIDGVRSILFMPDAISYLLTGKEVCEYTILSTSQLMNPETCRIEERLLEPLHIPVEKFPPVVMPGRIIGNLRDDVAAEIGLSAIPVVAVAGHDTASAVAAVPASGRNFAYLSSGTWSLMGVETDAPVINTETETLNFTNEGGVEGTIRLLKNICGMWLLERCRLNWGDTSYPELISEADACEPFRSLINPDDDCFANPADMEKAIAEYCRVTGQAVPEKRGQVVRCIFESLALRYRQVLENLRSLSPRPIDTLHVIGGGSRNDLLNQFTANAIGIPVIAGPSEATAIGNVMIQAMATGEATDVAGMRQLINRSIPLKTYQPQDTEAWDAAYIHFKNCVR